MDTETKASNARALNDRPGLFAYGFWCFLLIAVGRINQLIPSLGSVPLAKIVMALTAFVLLVGSSRRVFRLPRESRALVKTGLWMIGILLVLTPMSFWRGASLEFVLTRLPVIVVTVVFMCGMGGSWRRLRGTLFVLVLCGLILARVAVSNYSGGRAEDVGTMYDPNDLAYLLVTVLPLAVAFLLTSRSKTKLLIYGLVIATLIGALLLTQSRGGLLGLLAVIGLIIFVPMRPSASGAVKPRKSPTLKIGLIVGIICIAIVIWWRLPLSAQERFSTLFKLGNDYNLNMQNTTGRGSIWLRGLRAALERPIGYGPATYTMVDLRFGGKWKVAHNSFLETLVELGVPGLILLVRMYYLSLRALQRAFRNLTKSRVAHSLSEFEQATFARALQFSLVGNMISGFFLSEEYSEILWVTFGCCMALLSVAAAGATPAGSSVRVLAAATRRNQYEAGRFNARLSRKLVR